MNRKNTKHAASQKKAQSSLEYLMSYGWAIILIATLIGAITLILNNPDETDKFNSSDPRSFIVKGTRIADGQVQLKLQNLTGGEINISSLSASGYDDCKVNGHDEIEGIKIGSGGEIEIVCTIKEGGSKTISISYTDTFELSRTVTLTGSSSSDEEITSTATLISSCPYTISESGDYKLSADLVASGSDCITISADDASLDCDGHSITNAAQSNSGILVTGDAASIQSCTITGFYSGISLDGSDGTEITASYFSGAIYGLAVSTSNSTRVTNNTFEDNSYFGIRFIESDGMGEEITGNTFNNDRTGIDGWKWDNYIVSDNQFNENRLAAIECQYCRGNIVSGNTMTDNGRGLILRYNSTSGSTFTDNTITGSTSNGVQLQSGHLHNITGNYICSDSGSNDIYCDGSYNGDISGNTATRIYDYRCGVFAGPECP